MQCFLAYFVDCFPLIIVRFCAPAPERYPSTQEGKLGPVVSSLLCGLEVQRELGEYYADGIPLSLHVGVCTLLLPRILHFMTPCEPLYQFICLRSWSLVVSCNALLVPCQMSESCYVVCGD